MEMWKELTKFYTVAFTVLFTLSHLTMTSEAFHNFYNITGCK
jgi:hypothetical protein